MKNSLLKILIFISALTFSNSVWGFTSTLKDAELLNSFNNTSKTVSWKHGHVNFSLSGSCLYMTGGKHWYGDTRILYMPNGADIRYNENTTYTLSWTNSGYDIEVTKVTINVERASGEDSYIKVGQGTKTGDLFDRLSSTNISSGSETYGNGQTVPVVFYKAFSWSTCAVNSITIEYNLKPQINVSNGNVEVTICDGNKKTINLSTLAKPVVTDGHVSYTYSVESVVPAANTSATTSTGHISSSTFYATQAGVYTLRISAESATCHQANSKTFTVTVTPAALSLTAPTASDIIYPATLASSSLTGGSAMVGTCEVGGTWAWQTPSTCPSVGDNQPFPVVFTPSANAGNYTNFITNAMVNVLAYIFTGEGDDDEKANIWAKDDNWNVNNTPTIENVVIIRHDVIIEDEVSAYSVTIDDGYKVTIAPTGGLTVGAGGITGATTTNLTLKADTIGATKGQTGYLRISPEYTGEMPQATVEMLRKGYTNGSVTDGAFSMTGNSTWQYVGCPIEANGKKVKLVVGGWINSWDETVGEWVNNRASLTVEPFRGFANTQSINANGAVNKCKGTLVQNRTYEMPLTYSSESTSELKGWNLLANSFSAPIQISKMASGFPAEAEASVYLFNTGTTDDPSGETDGAGTYTKIPVGWAGQNVGGVIYGNTIPSMQGFFVKTSSAANLKFKYSEIVWDADYSTAAPNKPLRVRAREVENDNDMQAIYISLLADSKCDNLHLIEMEDFSTEYENGYDAHTMPVGAFNVFAVEGEDHLGVDATNSIAGTYVGVRTGAETAYTFRFSHLLSENGFALLDNETNETIDIYEGTEYTFFAAPDTTITERFQIVAREDAPSITTGVDNTENGVKVHKFIKDNQLFILKNGVLYDALGKRVR